MGAVTSNGYQRLQSGFWFKMSDNSSPYSTTDGVNFTAVSGGATTLASAAQAAVGIIAKANVFGSLSTSGGLVTLFNDSFDTTLDLNKWTLSGTTPPAASGTSVLLSLTAANSVSSSMISVPSFTPQGAPYVLAGQMTLGAQQANPNVVRIFGASVVTGFTAGNPTTDGHQWEVDVTGALCACVYIAGVRYVVNSTNPALITAPGSWAANMTMSNYGQPLTWPASGTAIVTMQYYSGLVYFFMASAITGMDIPVGVASYQPNVAALPIRIASISTPAVSTVLATTYTVSGMLLGAIGGSNFTQADPVYPWRLQTVDALGRSATMTPELTATGSITTQNLVPGGVATAGSAVSLATNGLANLMVQVTGTYTGALSLQITVDNVNWITVGGTPLFNVNTGTALASITSALQSIFQCSNVSSVIGVRITALAAQTGTAVVTMRATAS